VPILRIYWKTDILQSQQAAFSSTFPILILRMPPSFLTRCSYDDTIAFVSQAKQINDRYWTTDMVKTQGEKAVQEALRARNMPASAEG
jgi:hypothetical protein